MQDIGCKGEEGAEGGFEFGFRGCGDEVEAEDLVGVGEVVGG